MGKFYKVHLTACPEGEVLKYAYGQISASPKTMNAVRSGEITLNERIGEGVCERCGNDEWMILPMSIKSVKEGGKAYIECLNCGNVTHL